MKITLSRSGEVTAQIPPGDEIARHAAASFYFVLDTPARIGKEHSGPEFAAAIADTFGCLHNGWNRAVVAHLMTLK